MFFQITFRFLSGKSLFVFETARFSFCRDYLNNAKIIIPNKQNLYAFEQKAGIIFQNIDNCQIEQDKLTELQLLILTKIFK